MHFRRSAPAVGAHLACRWVRGNVRNRRGHVHAREAGNEHVCSRTASSPAYALQAHRPEGKSSSNRQANSPARCGIYGQRKKFSTFFFAQQHKRLRQKNRRIVIFALMNFWNQRILNIENCADCLFNMSTGGSTPDRVPIALTQTEVDHEKRESNESRRKAGLSIG